MRLLHPDVAGDVQFRLFDCARKRFPLREASGDRGGVSATRPMQSRAFDERRGKNPFTFPIPQYIRRLARSWQMTAFDQCGAAKILL